MTEEVLPSFDRASIASPDDAVQRAALLQLLALYAQLADARETDRWAMFFTEHGTFTIVPFSDGGAAPAEFVLRGRSAILDSLRAQHGSLRERGVQRRHLLTNPVVWELTRSSARLAVTLQLVESRAGSAPILVGTGRYDGRAVHSEEGWRMAEWTLHSDQALPSGEPALGSVARKDSAQ